MVAGTGAFSVIVQEEGGGGVVIGTVQIYGVVAELFEVIMSAG